MSERYAVAEQVWATLVAGQELDVGGLGHFSIDEYKAYEGRNPRTGATIKVPRKRLPFFKADPAAYDMLVDISKSPSPTHWVTAMLAELAEGKPAVFGRVGVFITRTKEGRRGRDPKTGAQTLVPARVVLTFLPSQQLKRALAEEAAAPVVDSGVLDLALAKLPADPPRSLAELDEALAAAQIEHDAAGVLRPDERKRTRDEILIAVGDNEARWSLDPRTNIVTETGDEPRQLAFARWASDVLLLATVRAVAGDAALSPADAQRVLARLSRFDIIDLPY